jgi:hypothetical protein
MPALGGSTVRSDTIPTRDDASNPAAVDHVWGGNIPAESWVDVDLGVDLDLDFIALRSNGFAVIMIMFFLNCLVGIAAIPWLNVTKPQTRRQQNGDILVIFGDIGPNLEQEY